MPATKKSTSVPVIDDSAFGDFAVADYSDRLWTKAYYATRELQGICAKRSNPDSFDWKVFNSKFADVFGTPDARKASLDDLLAYAHKKFGMGVDELIEANVRSFQRRDEWKARKAAQSSVSEHSDFDFPEDDTADFR